MTTKLLVIVTFLVSSVRSQRVCDPIIFPNHKHTSSILRHSNGELQFCPEEQSQGAAAGYSLLEISGNPQNRAANVLIGELTAKGRVITIKWRCGGSLIAPQFVLTSAHCMNTADIATFIRITSNDVEGQAPLETDSTINRLYIHPEYEKSQLYFDIAIIRMNEPVWGFQTAILPTNDTFLQNTDIRLSGWIKSSQNFGDLNLTTDTVSIVLHRRCSTFYNLPQLPNEIKMDQVCGRIPTNSSIKPCSGSILGILESGSTNVVIGIPSFTFGCNNERPLVFTNIVFFSSWIRTIIEYTLEHCGYPHRR